jgi:hypothetical protein
MSKVENCPANIVIRDDKDGKVYECKGRYYGDGRVLVQHGDRMLMCDPACFDEDNPKRLFDYNKDRWTKFSLVSILLVASFIRKNR